MTWTSRDASIDGGVRRVLKCRRLACERPWGVDGLEPDPPPDRPRLLLPRLRQLFRARAGAAEDVAIHAVARAGRLAGAHGRPRCAGDRAPTLPAGDDPRNSVGPRLEYGAGLPRGLLALPIRGSSRRHPPPRSGRAVRLRPAAGERDPGHLHTATVAFALPPHGDHLRGGGPVDLFRGQR